MPHKSHQKLRQSTTTKANPSLEKLVLFVAVVEPLMTIPQIIQIYVQHDTGSSLLTWTLYLFASVVWLIYGAKTRSIPIITTSILWVVMEAAVALGLLFVH